MCNETTLSERIQYAMDMRNLTQADISRMTGLSTAVLSQIISGKTTNPTFEKVLKIADALNVPLDYLAGRIHYSLIKF